MAQLVEPEFSGVGPLTESHNDAVAGSLDLFQATVQEKGIESSRENCFKPSITNSEGPFEFHIPKEGKLYPDMSTARLVGSFKVMKVNPSGALENLSDSDELSIVNNAPMSLFKAVETSIQNVNVSYISTPKAHYKNYLTTALSYGTDAVNTHLAASRWLMDTPGIFEWSQIEEDQEVEVEMREKPAEQAAEGTTPPAKKKYLMTKPHKLSALEERAKWIKNSQSVDFACPLVSDLFGASRLLPPNVDIRIKFTRSSDDLVLITKKDDTNNYRIVIQDLSLYLTKMIVNPLVVKKHEQMLASGQRCKFPVIRTTIKTQGQFGPNQTFLHLSNIYTGRLPSCILVFLVDTEAYNGSRHKNPYLFEHFDLSEVSFRVNGVQLPAVPYTPDFKKKLYSRMYRGFFDHLGVHYGPASHQISKELYANGFTVTPLDLSPDLCLQYHTHKDISGDMSLTMKLETPPLKPVSVVTWASFADTLYIDVDGEAEIQATHG